MINFPSPKNFGQIPKILYKKFSRHYGKENCASSEAQKVT